MGSTVFALFESARYIVTKKKKKKLSNHPHFLIMSYERITVRYAVSLALYCTLIRISRQSDIISILSIHVKSHHEFIDPLLKELAARGHRVYSYSPFPKVEKTPNYVDFDISKCFPSVEMTLNDSIKHTDRSGPFFTMRMISNLAPTYEKFTTCEPLMRLWLDHSEGQGEDGRRSRYDLLIADALNVDIFSAYAYKLGIPLIVWTPNVMLSWLAGRMGNPNNPSYTAQTFGDYGSPATNFLLRIRNVYVTMVYQLTNRFYNQRKSQRLVEQLLKEHGDKDHITDSNTSSSSSSSSSLSSSSSSLSSSAVQMTSDISMMFINSHHSLNAILPLVPGIVEIGGLNVKRKPSPLPGDIEKFINESEHGVVYFCMGSLLRGSSFPEDKRDAFLYAFSKIPQRVLWKWEGDVLPGKSNNIMTAKWMPQRDILAHPKVKLFISHGGLLGTNEAVYEGVPILGIPIFGDQRTNVKSIEASGAGDMLDYNEISKEVVLEKIQRLLNDPKYRENAKELSRRYRDRPMSPLDTAVYWTEYVIRHKGAHHLRSAAVDMPWYQYLLLDVIAFVLFVLITFLVIVYYSLKLTLRFVLNKFLRKQAGVGTDNKKVKSN